MPIHQMLSKFISEAAWAKACRACVWVCSRQFWGGCCHWGRDKHACPRLWGRTWEHKGRGAEIYPRVASPLSAGTGDWLRDRQGSQVAMSIRVSTCEPVEVSTGNIPFAGVPGQAQNQPGSPWRKASRVTLCSTGTSWAHEDSRVCVSCCLRTTLGSLVKPWQP